MATLVSSRQTALHAQQSNPVVSPEKLAPILARAQQSNSSVSFQKVMDKFIETSTIFQGISKQVLVDAIRGQKLLIKSFVWGDSIIRENDKKCETCYVLLQGGVDVVLGTEVIATSNVTGSFGIIWFLTGERSAHVRAKEGGSLVLEISKEFIHSQSDKIQAMFYRNIAREIAELITEINTIAFWPGSCTSKLEAIEQRCSDIVMLSSVISKNVKTSISSPKKRASYSDAPSFHDAIRRFVSMSGTFFGIQSAFIGEAIRKREVSIQEFSPNETIIENGSEDCNELYVILKGGVEVILEDKIIAKSAGITSFGTVGFLTGTRSAKVQSTVDGAFVLQIPLDFIEKQTPEFQAQFYQNIAREMSTIITNMNDILFGKDTTTDCHEKMRGISEDVFGKVL